MDNKRKVKDCFESKQLYNNSNKFKKIKLTYKLINNLIKKLFK